MATPFMAYMDVPAVGQPNGRIVVLLHGMNFYGEYWSGTIDVLRKEGFRRGPGSNRLWPFDQGGYSVQPLGYGREHSETSRDAGHPEG
jgi:hypothetical protein